MGLFLLAGDGEVLGMGSGGNGVGLVRSTGKEARRRRGVESDAAAATGGVG